LICGNNGGARLATLGAMPPELTALADLFDVLPDAVVVIDDSGRIALANAAVERILGHPPHALLGAPLEVLIPERHRTAHRSSVESFRATGHAAPMGSRPVLHALAQSGEEVPVSIAIANFELGAATYSVAVLRDASGLRAHLDEVLSRAETDPLTQVGNRGYLSRRIAEAIAAQHAFGILFIDLAGFKQVNDAFGHSFGDTALRLVARRLQALVRPRDAVARLGGDEFVLVLDGVGESALLERRAADVVAAVGRPFRVGDQPIHIGADVGGALFPRDGRTETELLAVADQRMYRAKEAARAKRRAARAGE
jgi:diguanylate cyclase (GGDEF)-like protein/PAS domain S-box-containing protein